jgi:hypothetical protein
MDVRRGVSYASFNGALMGACSREASKRGR